MKSKLAFIAVVVLILFLAGCSSLPPKVSAMHGRSLTPQPSANQPYTEDDAIAVFYANKGLEQYDVTDCVLVNDDKMPKLKAVLSFYDKKKNNSSNVAFIYGEVSQEVCFASNEAEGVRTYELADNGRLAYVGNGAVTLSIRKTDTNEVIKFKITYSYDESTATTNFDCIAVK